MPALAAAQFQPNFTNPLHSLDRGGHVVGWDRDLLNPNVLRDGMHDWALANNRMAKVLEAKGYPYQYLFCRNAGHGVGNAQARFLPHAIERVWRGHAPKKSE